MAIAITPTQEVADFWGVPLRCAQKWIAADKPVDDRVEMARTILAQRTAPTQAKRRARELLKAEGLPLPSRNGAGESDPTSDADWEEFCDKTAGRYADAKEKDAQLMRFRDFAVFKLEKSNAIGDESGMKIFAKLHIEYEQAIRQNKLADLRLGIDEGLLVPKAEFERLLRALVYWLMRCTDAHLPELCPRLLGKAGMEDVRAVLEPALLQVRFLQPLARATATRAGVTLPGWAVDCLRDAADDYIEDGAAEFEKEFIHENKHQIGTES